ncbi:MAG: RNA 2',3'-cyclic phosphodiesterase [Chloroflexota bacterium]|nr:RNA 2',3'-cyclic phosphodiesterase [Chloroflexota bacterium]
MRAFVAISYPQELRVELAKRARALVGNVRDVRCMSAESLHLTLAFLGEVPAHSTDSIRSGLEAATRGRSPFVLRFGGGGTFPTGGEPRVAWVGVTGDLDAVRDLQAAVTREMQGIGLRMGSRPFSPHVTLARIGRQATPSTRMGVARRFEAANLGALGTHTVGAVALFESDLSPAGAVYREVLEVDFDPDAPPAAETERGFRLFNRRR